MVLAIHGLTLSGAKEGLKFYLVPDFSKIDGSVVVSALNQAFFTLSTGMGGMAIFGSYIGKDRSLMGESVHVIVLDTFVAVIAGVILFCACFTYGLEVNAGPSLLFDTMATVFSHMPGGRWWGALFFLFMVFAAMSTVLGDCENILAMVRELTGWSRPKGCVVCAAGIFVLALTTALGYSVIKFQPFAEGTAWLDLWDFIVSNYILPLGSLVLALFCCNKFGWGWYKFVEEANTGKGLKIKSWMKPIFKYFVPAAILLSGFTNNYRALIIGTNLGGLGTMIASMASLISFKYISREDASLRGKYFICFTAANVILLVILLAAAKILGQL